MAALDGMSVRHHEVLVRKGSSASPPLEAVVAQLTGAGRADKAVRLVQTAAASGDPEALFLLARWQLFGQFVARDHAAARRSVGMAAAKKHLAARHLHASFVAGGIGAAADPSEARTLLDAIDDPVAAEQRVLLDAMTDDVPPRLLRSENPLIFMLPGLISPAEADYLIRQAEPRMRRSYIVDATGREVPDPGRTSAGTAFGWSLSTPVVYALNRRFARASETAVEAGEPLQILRYDVGDEYRPHFDALPGEANQRDWTLLTMLSPSISGGETGFDAIGLTVRLERGEGLLFRNVTPDGVPDKLTLHSGRPVIAGEKWLATRWIRRGAFAG